MTNGRWPMTGDRGAACRPRSPDRTMPLRYLCPTPARTAGHGISHWSLGIHWLLVIHWSLGIHWLLVIHWSLGIPWSLGIHWSLGIGHWSLPLVMHDTLSTALAPSLHHSITRPLPTAPTVRACGRRGRRSWRRHQWPAIQSR